MLKIPLKVQTNGLKIKNVFQKLLGISLKVRYSNLIKKPTNRSNVFKLHRKNLIIVANLR